MHALPCHLDIPGGTVIRTWATPSPDRVSRVNYGSTTGQLWIFLTTRNRETGGRRRRPPMAHGRPCPEGLKRTRTPLPITIRRVETPPGCRHRLPASLTNCAKRRALKSFTATGLRTVRTWLKWGFGAGQRVSGGGARLSETMLTELTPFDRRGDRGAIFSQAGSKLISPARAVIETRKIRTHGNMEYGQDGGYIGGDGIPSDLDGRHGSREQS